MSENLSFSNSFSGRYRISFIVDDKDAVLTQAGQKAPVPKAYVKLNKIGKQMKVALGNSQKCFVLIFLRKAQKLLSKSPELTC